jgi:hypothetical protein
MLRRGQSPAFSSRLASSLLMAAALVQAPRQYDAALFENEYIRAHLVTLNLIGHYRTAADTPQVVFCLGSFLVSRDNGSRRRCTNEQLLFIDRGDQIELRADVEPRPDLLVIELKQPPTGEFLLIQEDAVNAASDAYQMLFENRSMRIIRMTLARGQRTKMHWHPGGDFLFPLTTSALRSTAPDGSALRLDLQARIPRWTGAATRHATENVGATEAVAMIFEVK